jgi:hypothetical protein
MNIAFKYICTKGLSFLTYGRIVHKILIFAWLWLSSSRDKVYKILTHLVKTLGSRKWCRNKLKELNMLS